MYSFKEFLPYYKRNTAVAVPVMITQAGQVMVQLADNIMVGHVGVAQLAGVSFANAIFAIGLVTMIGFAQGLTPLVGESFGRGDTPSAARYLRNSLLLNTIFFACIGAILFAALKAMPLMGQDPQVLKYAQKYFGIMLLSIVPMLFFFTSRFFAEGVGNTKYAMWTTLAANLLNVLLNWVLIFGHWGMPAMGVSGAAMSTLISRIVTAVVFVILLFSANDLKGYTVMALDGKPEKAAMGRLFHLSVPIAFSSMLESTAFSFAAIMIGWMGKNELAAHQITHNLSQLSFMIATGVGAAATIRVSHQYGAGNFKGTLMAGRASIHMALVYMGTCGVLFFCFRHLLPRAYTDDPTVIALASQLILVLVMYQIVDAIQLASMSSLRGLKDTRIPMVYAFISYYVVAIPVGYVLGFTLDLGPMGVWFGLMAGLGTAAVLFYARFRRLCRRFFD